MHNKTHHSLSTGQKLALTSLSILALSLPVALWSTYQTINTLPKATGQQEAVSVPSANGTDNTPAGYEIISGDTPVGPPDVNRDPIVITTSLWMEAGQSTTTPIQAYDLNTGDDLSMTLTGLPPSLQRGSCESRVENEIKIIECTVSGQVSTPGFYTFEAVVSDNKGGQNTQTVELSVVGL